MRHARRQLIAAATLSILDVAPCPGSRRKGVAEAVSTYFKTTNFAIELEDRHNELFEHMTMPMLILQGRNDPGQHPEEYENSPSFVSDCRVEFVDASHFCHIENPTAVNAAIRSWLDERPINS